MIGATFIWEETGKCSWTMPNLSPALALGWVLTLVTQETLPLAVPSREPEGGLRMTHPEGVMKGKPTQALRGDPVSSLKEN